MQRFSKDHPEDVVFFEPLHEDLARKPPVLSNGVKRKHPIANTDAHPIHGLVDVLRVLRVQVLSFRVALVLPLEVVYLFSQDLDGVELLLQYWHLEALLSYLELDVLGPEIHKGRVVILFDGLSLFTGLLDMMTSYGSQHILMQVDKGL